MSYDYTDEAEMLIQSGKLEAYQLASKLMLDSAVVEFMQGNDHVAQAFREQSEEFRKLGDKVMEYRNTLRARINMQKEKDSKEADSISEETRVKLRES